MIIGPCQSHGPWGADTSLAGFVSKTFQKYLHLVWSLPYLDAMQNLMAIRISFRLLVNGVPHGKNKATIKLVDVYVFDVSSVFEQCVRAWLHFQSASVRRTIQDTNCSFNLTSNIKNLRLGV